MMVLHASELMPVVRAALQRGQSVSLTANGSSMLPFIADGATIELVPPRIPVRLGDIVLAQSSADQYVLHRVVKIEGDSIFLRGDAQSHREGPFPSQALLALAVTASIHGDVRVLDRGGWHWAGLLWMHSGRAGVSLLQIGLSLRMRAGALRRYLSFSKKSRQTISV